MKQKIIVALFSLALTPTLHILAQNGSQLINATDMTRIQSISSVSLNKTGTQAICTLTTIEPDGEGQWEYKYVNHLYLVPTDGSSAPKRLTTSESSSQAAWSPDGKTLAFVRSVDGKPQVFLLPLDGGEPFQFTHFRYGAGTPKWSPDGKKIIFSSNIELEKLRKDSVLNPGHQGPPWPQEQAEPQTGWDPAQALTAKANPDGSLSEMRSFLDQDREDKKAKVLDRLNFQDETQVSASISFNHFFVQRLDSGAQAVQLTHGFFSYTDVDFSPDGSQLIVTGNLDSTKHPDREPGDQIYLADSMGRNLHLLIGKKDTSCGNARISRSGKWLAFEYVPTEKVSNVQLAIMPIAGSAGDVVTIDFDRNAPHLVWSENDKYLYFNAASNGGVPVYRLSLQTRKIERLTDFGSGITSFDLAHDRIVFSKTEVADPFELYSDNLDLKQPKRISNFHTGWLASKKLSFPEKHEFKNSLGMTVEYWVMKPVGYETGKHYPLLLEIHGGPSAMWGPGENTMWHEFQFFCSRGYGVVYCNPRGSGGYGKEFLRAIIDDWGAGPTADVLTALDRAVEEGWADTTKLLVSGGSYAGYLVAWIIAHDHRFAAACSQRGVYDLATFFGEGNAWRLVPEYFGGYPWEPKVKAILVRESPITYVEQIHTPYIIFHGESDRRTGYVQSEMLYRSLKVLGRPVEYVRHPGATHEITRSGDLRQRMDQMLRTYEFFERWITK